MMSEIQIIPNLGKGLPVVGEEIDGVLNLRELAVGDDIKTPIKLRSCRIEAIEATLCKFHQPVSMEELEVRLDSSFYACYFFGGLRIINCHFHGSLDFQSGGHNKDDHEFLLDGSQFDGFVNFFDCWFEGPVIKKKCNFIFGTNIFGNQGQPFDVTFDQVPIVEGTIGKLDLSGG